MGLRIDGYELRVYNQGTRFVVYFVGFRAYILDIGL
jgi:hypothetical protein